MFSSVGVSPDEARRTLTRFNSASARAAQSGVPSAAKALSRLQQCFSGQPFLLTPPLHPADFQDAARPFEWQLERFVGSPALLESI